MKRTLWLVLAVGVVLACSGTGSGGGGGGGGGAPVGQPVAGDPGGPERTKQKHGREKAGKGKAGKGKGRRSRDDKGNLPAEVVDAYAKDCHHVFPPDSEEADVKDDECTFLEFDQNCGPDPFGCWSTMEECKTGCGAPCSKCQRRCGDTCDDCKSACKDGGDKCVRACAEARAECRETCVDPREACLDGCGDAMVACDEAAERKVANKCPHCEDIERCMMEHDQKACQKKFPDDAPECFGNGWCWF